MFYQLADKEKNFHLLVRLLLRVNVKSLAVNRSA